MILILVSFPQSNPADFRFYANAVYDKGRYSHIVFLEKNESTVPERGADRPAVLVTLPPKVQRWRKGKIYSDLQFPSKRRTKESKQQKNATFFSLHILIQRCIVCEKLDPKWDEDTKLMMMIKILLYIDPEPQHCRLPNYLIGIEHWTYNYMYRYQYMFIIYENISDRLHVSNIIIQYF